MLRVSISNEMKRKVLVLMSTKNVSGPAKQLFQFIKYASGSGFKWILSDTDNGYDNWEYREEAIKRGIQFVTLKETFRFDPSSIWQVYKIIREQKIDMIQSHGYKPDTIAFILKMFTGLPWLAFVHGWTAEDTKVRLYNKLDGYLLRYPDKIVSVSDSYRNRLIAMGIPAAKIVTIHNALDPKEHITPYQDVRKKLGFSKDNFVIGVIGRLSSEKGQRVFLDAFKEIIVSVPDVKVLIIGDGPDMGSLKKHSCSSGFNGSVKFLGYQADILPFYKAIDLLVIPSFSEGLPNVMLEAMYYEKPVVATSVGGIPEVITHNKNGVLVNPGDSKSLAREIISLLLDKERMVSLAKNGKEIILKNYLSETRAKKIIDAYKMLLEL